MGLKVANNAYGLLAAGISDSDTVIALQSGHGARFGTIVAGSGNYMYATLLNASNQLEVVKITDISTDSLTVSRGEDGTTPLAYSSGDRLEARPCAGVINDLLALITATWTTGDAKLTLKTTADAGWVLANDGTIGNAASGATTRANADTEALFTLLWNNIIDTWCAVSSGRGASAAADFAANKTIALPKAVGRALAVFGTGSGLTARVLGEILGEETHALTAAENGPHDHPGSTISGTAASAGDHAHIQRSEQNDNLATESGGGANPRLDTIQDSVNAPGTNTTANAGAHTHSVTGTAAVASDGSGDPHENMPPESFWNAMVKL